MPKEDWIRRSKNLFIREPTLTREREEMGPGFSRRRSKGFWMRCDGTEQREIRRGEMQNMEMKRLSSIIRATYDTLSSPANLHLCHGEAPVRHQYAAPVTLKRPGGVVRRATKLDLDSRLNAAAYRLGWCQPPIRRPLQHHVSNTCEWKK